jgi:hypothetical protein
MSISGHCRLPRMRGILGVNVTAASTSSGARTDAGRDPGLAEDRS